MKGIQFRVHLHYGGVQNIFKCIIHCISQQKCTNLSLYQDVHIEVDYLNPSPIFLYSRSSMSNTFMCFFHFGSGTFRYLQGVRNVTNSPVLFDQLLFRSIYTMSYFFESDTLKYRYLRTSTHIITGIYTIVCVGIRHPKFMDIEGSILLIFSILFLFVL